LEIQDSLLIKNITKNML